MRKSAILLLLGFLAASPAVLAVEGTRSVESPLGGNGHSVSFDGRLFLIARGNGWNAHVFRPQNVGYDLGGYPDVMAGAFSPEYSLDASSLGENAVAICEPNPSQTPFRCTIDGAAD